MGRAGVTEPEVFTAPQFSAVDVERGIEVGGKSFRRNSLPSRRERNGTVQAGLAHL